MLVGLSDPPGATDRVAGHNSLPEFRVSLPDHKDRDDEVTIPAHQANADKGQTAYLWDVP